MPADPIATSDAVAKEIAELDVRLRITRPRLATGDPGDQKAGGAQSPAARASRVERANASRYSK